MSIENIKSIAEKTLQQPELTLQVNQTGQNLSIVINRPKELEVNYDDLARKILEAFLVDLSAENLVNIEGIKFFGRIKGQPKQEWQKLQKLNTLAQKKVEPLPSDVKPQSIISSPTTPITSSPEIKPQTNINPSPPLINSYPEPVNPKPSNSYQPRSAAIYEQPNAWDLMNDFKFGQLLTNFKDIISTASLIGIFLILLTNLLAGQKPQSVAWEYKIEAISDLIFIEQMDSHGKNGWELVSARRAVTDGTASYECIFKRLKK